ncbi:MAG: hypothetical protein HYV60_14425, partial [Planctomycetia bacterium]|nr:hypothetical protein [Planctomycetia bacterium]
MAHWWRGVMLMAMAVLLTPAAFAQEMSDTDAVEAGREAFDGGVTFPWYDSDSDSLQRLNVEPPDDVTNRGSKWERAIKAKKARTPWSMPAWLWMMLEVL